MSDDETKKPRGPDDFKKHLEDIQEFFKQKLGADNVTVMMGPEADGADEDDPPSEERKSKVSQALKFSLTPSEVKRHLDRFVIGQDEAKKTLAVAVCDHYNHVRRVHAATGKGEAIEYVKQNVILLGPTGVGKTYLIRTVAQLIGVPFVKADITKFSETGYVGGDVDDLVRELVRMADGDIELAEYGIIFLDEVDKIASSGAMVGRDVSGRGVQTGLLKLLEETEVQARSPNDISAHFQEIMNMRRGKTGKRTINTRNILFVVSGAFTGIEEIIEKRLSERNIGFAAATGLARRTRDGLMAQVTTKDFVDYGFEPEFIGRLPIRVDLRDLTEDDLFRILTTSEGSILKQHAQNFLGYGIDVEVDDGACRAVAARAMQEKTGARGLMTVLESSLRPFKFHLPDSPVKAFVVRRETIENPQAYLEKVLKDPQGSEREYAEAAVRRFEHDLEVEAGVRLRLDDSSVAMAAAIAKELHMKVPDYLRTVFGSHVDFLKKVRSETGRVEFPVTPQILNRPEEGIESWLGRKAS